MLKGFLFLALLTRGPPVTLHAHHLTGVESRSATPVLPRWLDCLANPYPWAAVTYFRKQVRHAKPKFVTGSYRNELLQ